jgi:glycosyltransferase involved in cell wall biosynthesis
MKIHFDNVNFSSSSGPNSFALRLAHQFGLFGHVIADPHDCDINLIFIESINSNIDPKAKIIQRLDGIWSKPEQFEVQNRIIKSIYDEADGVIFQSEFDKKFIETHWNPKSKNDVIHNGIALDPIVQLEPGIEKLRNEYELVFVCSAAWHRQKRLKENIELFQYLRASSTKRCCLIIMGKAADHIIADKDIFYSGELPHEICLQIFSIADWMIHLSYADHCPNVCIEALSVKCPIICTNIGGTQEIVKDHGFIIKEDYIFDFQPFDYDNPPKINLDRLFRGAPRLGANSPPITLKSSLPQIDKNSFDNSYLDIKHVAEQYLNFFQKVLEK